MTERLTSRRQMASIPPILLQYVDKQPDAECWVWTGSRDQKGYGKVSFAAADGGRRKAGAHRALYIILRGDVETGLDLDHLCRDRSCVNPWHLEPVTSRENQSRSVGPWAEGVRSKAENGTCPKGHSRWTPRGTCADCCSDRSREANRLVMEAARLLGLTQRQYAARYGYSMSVAREHIAAEVREDDFYMAIRGDDSGPMLTLSDVLNTAAARIAKGERP